MIMEWKKLTPKDLDNLPKGTRVMRDGVEDNYWAYDGRENPDVPDSRHLFSKGGKSYAVEGQSIMEGEFQVEAGRPVLVMMPQDVRDLRNPWKSYVGEIEGLTRETEIALKKGAYPKDRQGEYRLPTHCKGGSVIEGNVSKEVYDASMGWRRQEAFPEVPEEVGRRSFQFLRELLGQRNIEYGKRVPHIYTKGRLIKRLKSMLPNGRKEEYVKDDFERECGSQYQMAAEVIDLLPEPATRGVRGMVFGGTVDHGYGDAENNIVTLSSTVMGGPKRMFCGILLHEIGHCSESAFSENERDQLCAIRDMISRKDGLLLTNYIGQAHVNRQGSFQEFIPEVFMAYVSQGEELRDHIERGPWREEWGTVYSMFKEKVFGGVEFV